MGLGIKKQDTVLVIAGKERGKKGRVISVRPAKSHVLVEKVNIVKKHMKPSRKFQQGGIIDREAPLHVSDVMLLCPKCDRPTRLGHLMLDTDRKVRVCKKCKEVID